MSIPFEQVCENTCSIDLSVTANLAPSFQSPFVIGSSSFVTLIFTVINIGIDPAYLPVLKIPLGTKRILQTPPNCVKYEGEKPFLRSSSSHIQSVRIGVEYRNCRQTLDVYLLFFILLGQIKSKLSYRLVTYKLASPSVTNM